MLLQQNAVRLHLRSLIIGKMTQARLPLGVRAEKLGADFYQFWVVVWPQGLDIDFPNLMVSFFHPGHQYKAMKFSIY